MSTQNDGGGPGGPWRTKPAPSPDLDALIALGRARLEASSWPVAVGGPPGCAS